MADVQTSELDAKLWPVNVGPRRVKFGNHGNHAIIAWQLQPYLWNNGYHSSTHCLTTVTMGIKVRSLLYLNNAT
jgi:hypothetical protein